MKNLTPLQLELNNLYKESIQPDNIQIAHSYIQNTRHLQPFGNIGYLRYAEFNNITISNSITIPVFDTDQSTVILLDCKNLETNKYTKITSHDFQLTPIHNLFNICHTIIITEGIFNAETIRQTFPQLNNSQSPTQVSSTLRASMNAKTYHLLAASVTNNIILAFDNDSAGQQATKSFIEFFNQYYPEINIIILDFPLNDLNEFYIKKKHQFEKTLYSQLQDYL